MRAMAAIPERQRPRERLLEHGAEPLADAELVAVLLGTGVRGSSRARPRARAARRVRRAARPGPGPARRAGPLAGRRPGEGGPAGRRRSGSPAGWHRSRRSGAVIADLRGGGGLVRPWLADARRERVVLVVCDNALRVRRAFVLTEGS